jgi:hypothetical protein
MLKGDPTLAVPLNVPVPIFLTVKLFVELVATNIVPYPMLPGLTWMIGVGTGALVALPLTVVFVPPPPLKFTL